MQRTVYVSDDSIMRLSAHINMDNNNPEGLHANCEECGAEIPIELTRCNACESDNL